MRYIAIALLLLPNALMAQDWDRLRDDSAVREAIVDRTIIWDAYTKQWFGPTGETDYFTERKATGRWAVRDGQYCSVWPPSDIWTCYDVQVSGDRIRFISSNLSISEGQYQK